MARLDERIVGKKVEALGIVLGGHFPKALVPFFKLLKVPGIEILQLTAQASSPSISLVSLLLGRFSLKTELLFFKSHTLYNRNQDPKNIIGRLVVLNVFYTTVRTTRVGQALKAGPIVRR